jgi:uncharacterized membrane protein YidH (DUF202 family)
MISENDLENKPIKHIINEMQLVLAEKRTALSILRTGLAVILLPMSVLTVLLAVSRYFDISKQLQYAIPLAFMTIGLFILGVYLIINSIRKIRKYDHAARMLLAHSEYLRALLDDEE